MIIAAKILWIVGSIVISVVGILHVRGIFFTQDLYPKNRRLMDAMKMAPMEVDDQSNLWKAWIGFNASFGMGLIFMGLVAGYLALLHMDFLKNMQLLLISTIFCTGFFVWVAEKYLIKAAFWTLCIPLLCYSLSYLLMLIDPG